MPGKLAALSALPATLLLAGCFGFGVSPTTMIEASDSGVLTPGIRMGIDLGYAGKGPPSQAHDGHALEIGWSRSAGDDQQAVASGQPPVRFGTQTFNAPAQLRHEFDFRFFEAAYRYRHFFGGNVGIEGLVGVAHTGLDFTVSSGAQRAAESLDSAGMIFGFGVIGRLRPGTAVHGRATLYAAGTYSDVSDARRFELSLVQSLGRHAALRAGYAFWRIDSEGESGSSDIKLKFSGPMLGLDLAF